MESVNRRKRNIVISVEEWLRLLKLLNGENLVIVKGIPEDAVATAAHYDFTRRSFIVTLEHESYEMYRPEEYLYEDKLRFIAKAPIETGIFLVFHND